ncbi:hypothetical protein ES319_D08G119400v1 [Gossypium barbadense]|uniref:Uncharacterized protein n=3 Tax=Gossypium TaxID=3633 RepID=A0A5J5QCU4_GOSBA|nr:hypothetical protein ES319_D08G119400v1 [Gossypium barbadense]TYG57238.1 hypothetical protein ES288_D08G126500v1 [Gossypium darwinii]TYH58057.1 hypothetical protein ES332_D08G129900v1 [Gossypium tomentosum]
MMAADASSMRGGGTTSFASSPSSNLLPNNLLLLTAFLAFALAQFLKLFTNCTPVPLFIFFPSFSLGISLPQEWLFWFCGVAGVILVFTSQDLKQNPFPCDGYSVARIVKLHFQQNSALEKGNVEGNPSSNSKGEAGYSRIGGQEQIQHPKISFGCTTCQQGYNCTNHTC